jgi:hypothetical protein
MSGWYGGDSAAEAVYQPSVWLGCVEKYFYLCISLLIAAVIVNNPAEHCKARLNAPSPSGSDFDWAGLVSSACSASRHFDACRMRRSGGSMFGAS